MPVPDNEGSYGCWDVQGSSVSVRIEYSLAALERASAEAVDGLYRFRHGGAEVGGVLYGAVANGVLRIEAVRPLECEYAFGPRFVLSDRDKSNLVSLIEDYENQADLTGLYPVGWYHSHTRSGIELSPRDLEIYERFFPERWQVALVLRPEQYGPVRAGFFFRERNRSIRSDRTLEEFTIGLRRRRTAEAEEPEPEAQEPEPLEREAAVQPEPVEPQPEQAAEPEAGAAVEEPAPVEEKPAGEYTVEPDPEPVPEAPDYAPVFYADEPKPRRAWRWVAALGVVAVLGAAAWYYFWAGRAQPLSLMVTDVGGQLLIEWDRTAGPIRRAQSAVLEIKDGKAEPRRVVLDADTLHGGNADYTRQYEIVDVKLTVDQRGGRAYESVRFVGQPVKRNPSPEELQVLRERDQLKEEVERLRDQLERTRRRGARR